MGWDDAGISGGRGEGYGKSVIVAISLNLFTESLLDGGPETVMTLFVYIFI